MRFRASLPSLASLRSAATLATALVLVLTAANGAARSSRVPPERGHAGEEPGEDALGALRSRFSLATLESSLDAAGALRERALERLSEIGTPGALQVIARWLEPSPSLTATDWLHVVRALAPHAKHPPARKWLGRILTGISSSEPGSRASSERAIELRARGIAALALAREGDPQSLELLGNALRQSSAQAELASNALLAHPPQLLAPILDARGTPSVALIETLERLGDQRAFHPLRELVRRGTAELQARAALALFRLGHLETVAVAAHWLENASGHLELLRSATEILLWTEHPQAATAFGRLLEKDAHGALELARRRPSRLLAPALDARFEALDGDDQRRALEVFGLSGGTVALSRLERALAVPHLADTAALALAHSPDTAAARVLRDTLKQKNTDLHALAVRAWVVRGWVRGERASELEAALAQLEKSRAPEERWLGSWGRAVASEQAALTAFTRDDWNAVASAALTVLVHSPAVAKAACVRLTLTDAPQLRAALAAGLVDADASRGVSTATLHGLLDESPELVGVIAPLLTSRGDPLRPSSLEGLLSSSDPRVRAAALRGVGGRGPEGLGVLWRSYQSEVEPAVRLAAVEALTALAPTPARARHLDWIRNFEPDPEVRKRARLGEAGGPAASVRGARSTWLRLENAEPGSLVVITTDAGLTFPALVPPDRVLPLLGFSDHSFTIHSTARAPRPNPTLHGRQPLGS